ncbi:tetratricopeptide repeat protein [Asticcacaulis sp. EMRT-3]|uniref:tetratricopeptide repeat protein n=1 Tax=Asticcacaulis sp. EMRT-3 TaxID=3040349 RepID=UPI0024AFE828|nr:tetratricopeptide repeat protein [Asticcacaulis sp. EMRT-3]MDI7776311.1 tetratricopeptide repeat protein [Asticcacaulis sp. EMRT-3]
MRPLIALGFGLFAALSLTGCQRLIDDISHIFDPHPRIDGQYACPRPPDPFQTDGFNGQEREIRYYRHLAFGNDFFAQLELANRYAAINAADKNLEDPIESSVWLVMALANSQGYAPMNRAFDPHGNTMASRYDKCRAFERERAYRMLDQELSRMDSGERDKVRDRVIYVQSTLGADGFRTLARLYDDQYGPMGEPADNPQAIRAMMRGANYGMSNVRTLFERSDVDAYLYNYKASETGDVSAYVLLKDFEKSAPDRAQYASFVETKARRWVAPYEFYPPEAPQGGVPHSDESRLSDAQSYALTRMDELPFIHVMRALDYLNLLHEACFDAKDVPKETVDGLRGMIGLPQEPERLTALDEVRAIQMAAVNGDSRSQLVLAVMYSEGVGVGVDYARAFHWYQQAEKQGSPEARYAMSTYFDLGLKGVADQDKAEAVVMQLDAALEGFKPSANRLQDVLAQVSQTAQP